MTNEAKKNAVEDEKLDVSYLMPHFQAAAAVNNQQQDEPSTSSQIRPSQLSMTGSRNLRPRQHQAPASHKNGSSSSTTSVGSNQESSLIGDSKYNQFSSVRIAKERALHHPLQNQHHPHNQHPQRRSRNNLIMGSDEDPKEYDRLQQLFKRGLIAAEVTGIGMCILIIIWTSVYAGGIYFLGSGNLKVINLHVVLMMIFMLYLHGHAALIYRIFPTQPKFKIKLLHGVLHLAVCIGIACGFAAAVEQHNIKGTPHFYSLHSWLGITSITLYYGQFLGGFAVFLLPYAPMSLRTAILPYHRFSGQILFSLCTGSVITGVMLKAIGTIGDDYQNLPATALVLNTTGFLALTFSVIISNMLGDARFRRRPRPEGEMLLAETAGGGGGGGSGSSD